MLPGKTCAIAAEMSKLKQTIQVTSTHSFICEFTNEFHDGTKAAYIAEFHDIHLAVRQEPEGAGHRMLEQLYQFVFNEDINPR